MSSACSEIVWLQGLFGDLGITFSDFITLYAHNICVASNLIFHEHTKHIEVDCHFIGDMFLAGIISLPRIATQHEIADILTKALTCACRAFFVDKLMLSTHQFEAEWNKR